MTSRARRAAIPDLFDQRHPEERERDEVLARLARIRRGFLRTIRAHVERLYWERWRALGERAYVTADDARKYFEGLPDVPPADEMSRNFLGCVFKGEGWEAAGFYKSRTKGSHANRVFRWVRISGGDLDL